MKSGSTQPRDAQNRIITRSLRFDPVHRDWEVFVWLLCNDNEAGVLINRHAYSGRAQAREGRFEDTVGDGSGMTRFVSEHGGVMPELPKGSAIAEIGKHSSEWAT